MGFMAMASNTDNTAQIAREFKSLKDFTGKLSADPTSYFLDHTSPILSYGMSSDYKTAIDNGSTMVRIGSTIFGSRSYS